MDFAQSENDLTGIERGLSLDFKRVLYRALRHWYVTVGVLILALVAAFYKNRYTQRVYPVSASIVIRETQETGGAELLYKNALIDPYRNYLNEPYIIKSYPLIERVVRDANLFISFYREGYLMTTEAYSYLPVKAAWCGADKVQPGRLVFELRDEHKFELRDLEGKRKESFTLGDTVIFDDLKICITRIPTKKMEPYIGVPFLIVVNDPTSVAGNYINRLGVQWAEEGAGVIVLSIETVDYEKEVDFLAALVTAYRELDLSKKNETADRTIDFIGSQLRSIKDSLRTVEFQLERFGNGSRVKDMSTEAQRLLSKMEGFEIQRSELLIRQNYYNYLDAYLNNGSNLDQIILPTSIGLNDPVLSSLLTQMVSIQLEIKMAADPERINPLVSKKIERMGEIKSDVKEALTSLRSTDKIRLDFLNKQLQENENQMAALPASERQLVSIQRNYALLENLYVFLMQKLSEAGISKAGNTSDIFPVNPPMRGAAIAPKPIQNYSLAILLGLMVPFGIFVILELVDNKIQSKEDIEKMTQIPLIGGVGHNTTGNNLIVSEKPKSSVAESFRALRSNLNYFTGNKAKQVFLVTSSISGEGKTFTTINLATVFALSGKSTLIVGADMRRPKIFEDFNCSNERGLSTYLSGISDFESSIQSTGIDNLYLVSGGPVPPNPSELLLTAAFETFVAKALERFEFVLIDTPPLALVTDAFVMSKFANHTVFVARQNYTPKEFVKSIDEYYKTGKFTRISILLNDIYKSGLGYGYGQGYAYTYGYSYGYGYSMKKKEGQGYYD